MAAVGESGGSAGHGGFGESNAGAISGMLGLGKGALSDIGGASPNLSAGGNVLSNIINRMNANVPGAPNADVSLGGTNPDDVTRANNPNEASRDQAKAAAEEHAAASERARAAMEANMSSYTSKFNTSVQQNPHGYTNQQQVNYTGEDATSRTVDEEARRATLSKYYSDTTNSLDSAVAEHGLEELGLEKDPKSMTGYSVKDKYKAEKALAAGLFGALTGLLSGGIVGVGSAAYSGYTGINDYNNIRDAQGLSLGLAGADYGDKPSTSNSNVTGSPQGGTRTGYGTDVGGRVGMDGSGGLYIPPGMGQQAPAAQQAAQAQPEAPADPVNPYQGGIADVGSYSAGLGGGAYQGRGAPEGRPFMSKDEYASYLGSTPEGYTPQGQTVQQIMYGVPTYTSWFNYNV